MKKLVRWIACYETIIEVPDSATEQDIKDAAANISVDVLGSEYQSDTWEVESITDVESIGGFNRGDIVIATPLNGDFEHEFQGRVTGFRNGLIQVEDQEAGVFECETSQLKIDEDADSE